MYRNIIYIGVTVAVLLLLTGNSPACDICGSDSTKISKLENEIAHLGKEVSQLKSELQQLKHLLMTEKPVVSDSVSTTESTEKDTGYWCTKSGNKRHNSSCRYYKASQGRPCGPNDGIPCKLCGG
ncbi:MAG TPA: hypothetical protein VKY57_13110 [Chitinispirillaceae bacterium]|nr:hypothetical protein [Chitinispirillaceae bacterium]